MRLRAPALLLVLSAVMPGCASTGAAGDGRSADFPSASIEDSHIPVSMKRSADGVPLFTLGTPAKRKRMVYAAEMTVDSLKSWPDATPAAVVVDGKTYVLLRAAASAADDPDKLNAPDAKMLEELERVRRTQVQWLSKWSFDSETGGCDVEAKRVEKIDLGYRRLRHGHLCDETCLSKFAACLGSDRKPDQIIEALIQRGGESVNEEDARSEAIKLARKQLLDLDASGWADGKPWWIDSTTRIVPFLDSEKMLVVVGSHQARPNVAYGNATIALDRVISRAIDLAGADAALAPGFTMTSRESGSSKEITTVSRNRLLGFDKAGTLEHGGRVYGLLLCDQGCLGILSKLTESELSFELVQRAIEARKR